MNSLQACSTENCLLCGTHSKAMLELFDQAPKNSFLMMFFSVIFTLTSISQTLFEGCSFMKVWIGQMKLWIFLKFQKDRQPLNFHSFEKAFE